jgi:hypothetical protein
VLHFAHIQYGTGNCGKRPTVLIAGGGHVLAVWVRSWPHEASLLSVSACIGLTIASCLSSRKCYGRSFVASTCSRQGVQWRHGDVWDLCLVETLLHVGVSQHMSAYKWAANFRLANTLTPNTSVCSSACGGLSLSLSLSLHGRHILTAHSLYFHMCALPSSAVWDLGRTNEIFQSRF